MPIKDYFEVNKEIINLPAGSSVSLFGPWCIFEDRTIDINFQVSPTTQDDEMGNPMEFYSEVTLYIDGVAVTTSK